MIKIIKSKTYWISTGIYLCLAVGSFSICGSLHGWGPFGGPPGCIPLGVFYAPLYYAVGLPAIVGKGTEEFWFGPLAIGLAVLVTLVCGFITSFFLRGLAKLKRNFDEFVRVKPKP